MKLLNWLPRLNRRQKIVRNLLAALGLAFLLWGIRDFGAPTLALAARWKAAEYGLDAPEIVYRSDWEQDRADVLLRWEDGRLASSVCCRYRWLSRRMGDYYFAEPGDPVTVLLPTATRSGIDGEELLTLYCHAALPEAARAAGTLRLRTIANGEPFDETYPLEAVPNQNGIYCFQAAPKHTSGRQSREEAAFWQYSCVVRESTGTDFACDAALTFYDGDGNAIYAYEEELWNTFPGGKDLG